MFDAVRSVGEARKWVAKQDTAIRLAEQAMLVATELITITTASLDWLKDRQDLYNSLESHRRKRGVSIIVDDHEGPPEFGAEESAARILGYGTYRAPIPGERLVCVGAIDTSVLGETDHAVTTGAIADAERTRKLAPLARKNADGTMHVLARIAENEAKAHFAISTLLKVLYTEQITPDVQEKPEPDKVMLTIIDLACGWLGLTPPSVRELFITGIATRVLPTEAPLSDTRLRAHLTDEGVDPAEIDQADIAYQRNVLLKRADWRWKARRQAAAKHIQMLTSKPIVIRR